MRRIYVLGTSEVGWVMVTRPKQEYTENDTPLPREMVVMFKAGYALILSPVRRFFGIPARLKYLIWYYNLSQW